MYHLVGHRPPNSLSSKSYYHLKFTQQKYPSPMVRRSNHGPTWSTLGGVRDHKHFVPNDGSYLTNYVLDHGPSMASMVLALGPGKLHFSIFSNPRCYNEYFNYFNMAHRAGSPNHYFLLSLSFSCFKLQLFDPQLVISFEFAFHIRWITEFHLFPFQAYIFSSSPLTFDNGQQVFPLCLASRCFSLCLSTCLI